MLGCESLKDLRGLPLVCNFENLDRASKLKSAPNRNPSSEMSYRHDKEKAVNVQVLVRCRPFSEDELRFNTPRVVTCNEFQREVAVSQTVAGKRTDRVFTFDKVFGPTSQQIDLYNQAIYPIVNEALEGFNCTIFAYGQTGTGKTYTMQGECKRSKNGPSGELPLQAGVIPRAVKQIFDTLECQNAEYSVKVTFLELYNEEITDLLAQEEISKASLEDKQKKVLPLMEDGKKGVLVRGLEEEIVKNSDEIFTLLERGSAKRRTAETLLNKQSSRSHSLFTVTIHIKESTPEGEELIKCGKLNLVDLAGSENISRSGAREGRAREAGEINKSLLTLGRVITALVEHSGHVPYRDSKLTRLLRDSLGGRTKTCIIATVSPAVHCLEETLSTLDYAHRARNIKNKPEVNQKMMKSTHIKDLYGEIERLKAELNATRERNGVYIPKERYCQEESDRKSMADEIEQMKILIETNQKKFDDMQEKYNQQLRHSVELSKNLEATEESLVHTSKLLATTREDLTRSQYNVKERDFIISEQNIAENALTNQAITLQSDLEKSIKENKSLFSKIVKENHLIATNKSVINRFQGDLVGKMSSLCSTVDSSMTQQNNQIQQMEEFCRSYLDFHDKSLEILNEKVSNARILYVSHLEAMQNSVHIQKAQINNSLEEISLLTCANQMSLEQILASGEDIADQLIDGLRVEISNQRKEIADFVQDLRKRFTNCAEHTKLMSTFVNELLTNLQIDSLKIQNHSSLINDIQEKHIINFRKDFENQSKIETEKLVSQMTSLLSSHIGEQNKMVAERLLCLGDVSFENKAYLDAHCSSMKSVANDAKNKWDNFVLKANNSFDDASNFVSTEHSQIEDVFEHCVAIVDVTSKHGKGTTKSVIEIAKEHLAEADALVSVATESNEQHDCQTTSVCISAEADVSKDSDDIVGFVKGITEHEHKSAFKMFDTLESQSVMLSEFGKDHAVQVEDISRHAENTFQQNYEEYEPSGDTPTRSETDLPSKGEIEALRSMPLDTLLNGFRENHPYVSTKEVKPSLIPRSPLIPKN
ncbi:Kinesin-related protein-like [Zostera marina]|uniref:Kinesin-related protein-like n=1 Tax=Zostera marina TaxID=29655 RepID=A0A0K9Q1D4_ZOSMR|nr:Kinesin-related protein-like [Zostera marina]